MQEDILEMRERYDEIGEYADDFDTFIEALPSTSLVSDTRYDERTYAAALFSVDDDVRDIIAQQPSLTKSHIDMQK